MVDKHEFHSREDRESLLGVVNSAVRYIWECSEYEKLLEVTDVLLRVQMQRMEVLRMKEEQKEYAQQRAPTEQMNEEMVRGLQLNRAQMMQNVAPLWGMQEQEEKNEM